MNDLSLIITVYEPYRYLVNGTLRALDQFWTGHPAAVLEDGDERLHVRFLNGLRRINTPFAVVMHEDYRLCGYVKQDKLNECLKLMREDNSVLSCSIAWETTLFKTPYKTTKFEELPVRELPGIDSTDWPYAIDFQIRIWRVCDLIHILENLPNNVTQHTLEPTCTKIFRELLYPQKHAVTYPFPVPKNACGAVDNNDKSEWIIPYDNIYHGGHKHHAEYES